MLKAIGEGFEARRVQVQDGAVLDWPERDVRTEDIEATIYSAVESTGRRCVRTRASDAATSTYRRPLRTRTDRSTNFGDSRGAGALSANWFATTS